MTGTLESSKPVSKDVGGRNNVIILTSGLTGSSVLTGLLARATFWTGTETFKKEYDTFENVALIKLNAALIERAGYVGRYQMEFRPDLLARIESLATRIDHAPYREFLSECERHQPWIWKDPRLWLTIRYWGRFLDWNRCKVIVLTRGLLNCWVSATLRRHIRSFQSMKRYELAIRQSIVGYLEQNRIGYLQTTYEQLITRPEQTIEELNAYLETGVALEDLKSIYRGRLYQSPRSSRFDLVKAALIYLKNYSERWDLQESRPEA